MHGGIVSDRFYKIYSYSTTTCSFMCNSLLIFAIILNKMNHVGPYRWLLLSFAVVDILISSVHTTMYPAVHMTEFGYICWGNHFLDKSTAFGFWASLFWAFLVYQTFILLAFHYVYRYVIFFNNELRKRCRHFSPPWLAWIQQNPWRNWVTLAISASLLYCGSICVAGGIGLYPTEASRRFFAPVLKEIYDIDLYAPNLPGYLAITYWISYYSATTGEWNEGVASNAHSLNDLRLFTNFLLDSSYTCMPHKNAPRNEKDEVSNSRNDITVSSLQTSTLVDGVLDGEIIHLESNARLMQRQLLRALIWQTLIPICTSYLPFGIFLTSPLISGIPLGEKGTLVLLSLQLFPFIDPLIILYFVQGFRISLPLIVHAAMVGPFAPSAAALSITTTTTTKGVHASNN
uniref:G protein-coupled receptor n=1 Tax=Pristionchus pacificus TaxID=54126 RepID=A0A8R1UW42_PRIPA